ncbi:TPA: hypothetical protein N2D99_002310 [Clostridium botulinum]|nr:hypothetical protein [Clostridium botulinum]
MDENIVLKSTVTGKRQITIPKKICELLNIETGQQVTFKKEEDKIIFGIEKEHEICFACNGTTKIEEHKCFICNGTGAIAKDIVADVYKLICSLSMNSRKYGVGYTLIQQEFDNKGNFKYKEFPIIKLKSNKFSENELLRIQDEMQKLIIEQFSPKSI